MVGRGGASAHGDKPEQGRDGKSVGYSGAPRGTQGVVLGCVTLSYKTDRLLLTLLFISSSVLFSKEDFRKANSIPLLSELLYLQPIASWDITGKKMGFTLSLNTV